MIFINFLVGLFLPRPHRDYYMARLALKADLAWQPYLHAMIFWGVALTLIFGDHHTVPPIDGLDWVWAFSGLLSPIIGFVSVWMMKHGNGRKRYIAFWLRLASDIGLATTILAYEIDSLYMLTAFRGANNDNEFNPFDDTIMFGALLFLLVLIWRDIKFLILTERLAVELTKEAR